MMSDASTCPPAGTHNSCGGSLGPGSLPIGPKPASEPEFALELGAFRVRRAMPVRTPRFRWPKLAHHVVEKVLRVDKLAFVIQHIAGANQKPFRGIDLD